MTAAAPTHHDVSAAIRAADDALRKRQLSLAANRIAELVAAAPTDTRPFLLQARLRQMEGDFAAMLASAHRAADLAPEDVTAVFVLIEALVMAGETAEALARLRVLERKHDADLAVLRRAAEAFTHLGCHEDADRCMQAALRMSADSVVCNFQAASCALAMGRLQEAEK